MTLTACPHVPGLLDVSPGSTHVPCARRARYGLSALDDEGLLKMAAFPMEPPPAKMLIASVDLGCSEKILYRFDVVCSERVLSSQGET